MLLSVRLFYARQAIKVAEMGGTNTVRMPFHISNDRIFWIKKEGESRETEANSSTRTRYVPYGSRDGRIERTPALRVLDPFFCFFVWVL